jgi:DNA-binding protein YbaB
MIFGNLGKMGEMIKQAQQLKSEIGKARYEAEADGVKVVINGELEVLEIKLPPSLAPGKVETAVREAVNRGLKTAKNDMAQKMSKLTGGLELPGM